MTPASSFYPPHPGTPAIPSSESHALGRTCGHRSSCPASPKKKRRHRAEARSGGQTALSGAAPSPVTPHSTSHSSHRSPFFPLSHLSSNLTWLKLHRRIASYRPCISSTLREKGCSLLCALVGACRQRGAVNRPFRMRDATGLKPGAGNGPVYQHRR